MFFSKKVALFLLFILGSFPVVVAFSSYAEERFKDVEIRVIRPKYFAKRKKFELGVQGTLIMNETFIYTLLASGLVTYHFKETLAVGLTGSLGYSIDKEDKRLLFDEFKIKTKILRTLYSFEADMQWTPIYGKWQTASGRLIYFDTYLSVGGGLTGIQWRYKDFCTKSAAGTSDIPADKVVPYPSFVFGVGQRYFVSKRNSYNISIKGHRIFYQSADGECGSDSTVSGQDTHDIVTMQIGASKFF